MTFKQTNKYLISYIQVNKHIHTPIPYSIRSWRVYSSAFVLRFPQNTTCVTSVWLDKWHMHTDTDIILVNFPNNHIFSYAFNFNLQMDGFQSLRSRRFPKSIPVFQFCSQTSILWSKTSYYLLIKFNVFIVDS